MTGRRPRRRAGKAAHTHRREHGRGRRTEPSVDPVAERRQRITGDAQRRPVRLRHQPPVEHMLPRGRRRGQAAVGGALIEVVGRHRTLVAQDDLLADDDRVISQKPLGSDIRWRRPVDRPAPRVEPEIPGGGHGSKVNPPLERPDVQRPRCDLAPGRRAGERRPAAVRLRRGREVIEPDRLSDDRRKRPGAARERALGLGIRLRERLEVGPGRRILADRRTAKELLRGDPRQVDRRVRVHETSPAGLRVGDELTVGRLGLGELAFLEREIADEVECVVAPR